MLAPSIFGQDLFDDWFGFPELRDLDRVEHNLYGRHPERLMKTDVHEQDDHFEVDIDLPGFHKEDISVELDKGYMTISAQKSLDRDEKKKGKVIRQERYAGSMQRSFYVGEEITEDDIKASFKHGVLSLEVPKKEEKKVPEKKTIMIEG